MKTFHYEIFFPPSSCFRRLPRLPSTPHIHMHTRTHTHTHAQALITTRTYTDIHTPTHPPRKSEDIAEAAASSQKLHYLPDSNIHRILALKESCEIIQSLYRDIDINFEKEGQKAKKVAGEVPCLKSGLSTKPSSGLRSFLFFTLSSAISQAPILCREPCQAPLIQGAQKLYKVPSSQGLQTSWEDSGKNHTKAWAVSTLRSAPCERSTCRWRGGPRGAGMVPGGRDGSWRKA